MTTVSSLNPFDRFNSDITAQQVFDHVVTHLSTMKERSYGVLADFMREREWGSLQAEESCLYRGPKGSSCAAGYLISDNEYSQMMEGRSFAAFPSDIMPARLKPHRQLIRDLQDSHDNEGNWRDGKDDLYHDLRIVAGSWGLSYELVDIIQFENA